MEIINLDSWHDFNNYVKSVYDNLEKERAERPGILLSDPLFRGQANHDWELQSTLERYFIKSFEKYNEVSWDEYNNLLSAIEPTIFSFVGDIYPLEELERPEMEGRHVPPNYGLMIYLRHHGFPSPLLDWSISPFVAAYFAFRDAGADTSGKVSIFCLREHYQPAISREDPHVRVLGPYVRTHMRHSIQQAEYTICVRREKNYGQEFNLYSPYAKAHWDDEFIIKLTLPLSIRDQVILDLYRMNIHEYSIFPNEEGLMKWLSYREFDKRRSRWDRNSRGRTDVEPQT